MPDKTMATLAKRSRAAHAPVRTILLADDEGGIRRYCKLELETDGYQVVLAEDGVDALEVLEVFSVDLVVLDESMPRCGGREAAQTIRRRYPNLPIILFTADPDYQRYRSAVVDEVVIKSDDLRELKETIARLLPSRPRAKTAPAVPVLDRIRSSLASSSYWPIQKLDCTLDEQSVVIRGVVGSYYHKQLAQELVRQLGLTQQICNSIRVLN